MMTRKLTRRSFITATGGLAVASLTPLSSPAKTVEPGLTEFTATLKVGDKHQLLASSATSYWLYTEKLHSKRRFDLVGIELAKELKTTRIELRTKRNRGSWSPWTAISRHNDHRPDNGHSKPWSEPIWVEGADYLQVRSTKPIQALKVKLINSTHTATAAERSAGVITALATANPKPKYHAKGVRPAIFKRTQWATSALKPRVTPSYGSVRVAFVHHTVSANGYKKTSSLAMVRAIAQYHRNSNGWNDIGYNFLVDQYGQIFEGRSGGIEREVIGAHAQGFNSASTGIAVLGTFGTSEVPQETLEALADLISWKLAVHGVPFKGRTKIQSAGGSQSRFSSGQKAKLNRVSGHRDGGRTECPGNSLYKQLPQLRSMVAERSNLLPQLTIQQQDSATIEPGTVELNGQLLTADGTAITDAKIKVKLLGSTGFKTVKTATTNSDGSWSITLSIQPKGTVQAVYVGDLSAQLGYSQRLKLIEPVQPPLQ